MTVYRHFYTVHGVMSILFSKVVNEPIAHRLSHAKLPEVGRRVCEHASARDSSHSLEARSCQIQEKGLHATRQ